MADMCVVCAQPGPLVCSCCKAVHYCGKQHQKHHWPEHKHHCRPFEVKVSKQLGRYLAATRDIKAGELLYEEAPTVVGPKLVQPSPVCLGCLKPPAGEASCPSCGWPACSPLCPGLTDPHCHAVECRVLSLAPVKHVKQCRYEFILPLRCLIMQKRNPRKWKIIMSMETHMNKRGPSTEVYEEIEQNVVKPLSNYLSLLEEDSLGDTSAEVIHRICGAIDVNALEITEDLAELLALLPTAFIMCHSCIPNTKHTFQNTRITVRAAVDIPKGQDITTMYTHMLWMTQARREHLRNTKYFLCECARCADPTELGTHISALRCLAETSQGVLCGGFQYPKDPLDDSCLWSCNKCPTTLTSREVCELISCLDEEVENIQMAMYYLGLALTSAGPLNSWSNLQTPDIEDENKPTVERLEDLLQKLGTVLHPNHYLCYKIKHSLIQLYGHQPGYYHRDLNNQALVRKTEMCRELIGVTDKLDPGHGRLGLYSAVLHYELSAALMELHSRSKNVSLARQAHAALEHQISFLPPLESVNSPEARMRELAKKSLIDVNKALAACAQNGNK